MTQETITESVSPATIAARSLQVAPRLREHLPVSEDAISAALRMVIDTEHQLIEGSAAMAFAAARARRAELEGQRIAIVSCGANISAGALVAALA